MPGAVGIQGLGKRALSPVSIPHSVYRAEHIHLANVHTVRPGVVLSSLHVGAGPSGIRAVGANVLPAMLGESTEPQSISFVAPHTPSPWGRVE